MAVSKMENHRVVCDECGILPFLTQTQETVSHICRKTGDIAVAILALLKCPHCDCHFCTVPGQMQAAGTHMCHKISIIHTLLKWTGAPQDRSSHKTGACSVAPCAAWADARSSSNGCELQKFAKVLRILGISVPHTHSWLCGVLCVEERYLCVCA